MSSALATHYAILSQWKIREKPMARPGDEVIRRPFEKRRRPAGASRGEGNAVFAGLVAGMHRSVRLDV